MSSIDLQRPQSATHGMVAATGGAAFLLAICILRVARLFDGNLVDSVLFIMGVTAGAIFLVDLAWQKVHLRPSTGIDFHYSNPSWSRSLLKFAGLLGSMGFVAFLYWLFPEYHGEFYNPYYEMLRIILPPWIALALPYFFLIDRKMREPFDGYWHMGKLVTFQWSAVDGKQVGQHLLGWLIKGYFLPMMFTLTCIALDAFLTFNFESLTAFRFWVVFLNDSLYLIDLGIISLGYLMALRITDTHFRSAEPTMLGWAVALACYEPFSSLINNQYLAYGTNYGWGSWLGNTPVMLSIWGSAILTLSAIYVWATVIFGARFSNLTNRGIITNGPYRWTKHPAYLAKNLSWWMISVPFMMPGTPAEVLRHCLLLLGVNFIYLMRAKTEEWHLSRDPDYVQYALWIEQHGIFRFVKQWPLLQYLSYRAPLQRAATRH